MSAERPNWLLTEQALTRILQHRLGAAYPKAAPRLARMGDGAANEGRVWGHEADHHGPRLVTHDRAGTRIDEIEYHHSYRQLQQLGYGGGIVAGTWDPALAPERGTAPKALTFGLGYLFAQAEPGLYCPICMTDGAATLLHKFGTAELKARFLPRLGSPDMARFYTGAMFLTEKEAGSDVGQVTTVAQGGKNVPGETVTLWGDKWFCSQRRRRRHHDPRAARGRGARHPGPGAVRAAAPAARTASRNAFRIERIKDKLGERSFPSGEVTLEGATAYLLGGPGQGFLQMTEMLNLSRLYNAVASVARDAPLAGRGAGVERGPRGLRQARHQPPAAGRDVDGHGLRAAGGAQLGLPRRRADGPGGLRPRHRGRAARLLRCSRRCSSTSPGKWAVKLASEGVEALGGNGYIEDWPMARVLRDAQVLPIWEGTTNILVLDAFRAIRKEAAHEVFFAELDTLLAEAPADIQARCAPLSHELGLALAELAQDATGEHAFRDWTDRAALLWAVAVSCSTSRGFGHETDVRAARRVLARHVPAGLLRKDRASAADVRHVAFG